MRAKDEMLKFKDELVLKAIKDKNAAISELRTKIVAILDCAYATHKLLGIPQEENKVKEGQELDEILFKLN